TRPPGTLSPSEGERDGVRGRFMEREKLDVSCAVGFGEHIFSSNRQTHEIRRSRNHGEQDESARNRGHAKVSNKGKRSFPMPFRVVRLFRGSLNSIVPAKPWGGADYLRVRGLTSAATTPR